MKYRVIVGVDVSKKTLDFVGLVDGEKLFHMQTTNNQKGIKSFYNKLSKEVDIDQDQWLTCMEHTGIYCNPLINYCIKQSEDLWIEDASKIKTFHGTSRGKNDAVDALRIADYAYSKQKKAILWVEPRQVIKNLKMLNNLRNRLIKSKKELSAPLKEEQGFEGEQLSEEHKLLLEPLLKNIKAQIKEVEKKMGQLIKADEHIKGLYKLITSVRGVGMIVAINTIIESNEFNKISCPKKMACHSGVAPFRYDSGTSVRSKSKVSHRANKRLKTLYHLAAMSAVSSKSGELKNYYERKIKEGKNKMAILNAVRNKIIHRIFACVRDNRKYEEVYSYSLV